MTEFNLWAQAGRVLRPGWGLVAALAFALGLIAGDAQAHAIVVSARPVMNSTVASGKVEIRLEFNSRIDRQHSRLSLRRPDGTSAAIASIADSAQNVLAARAEAAMAGKWRLDWVVLSLDGHITRGEVSFSVR